MLRRESKDSPHQVRKANHYRTGYKQAGQRCQQEQFEDARLLPAQELNADREILFQDLSDTHRDFLLLIVQLNETLQNGGEKKAGHRSPKDRRKSKSGIDHAAQKRSDQPGNGLHLVDRRIALH